MHMPPNLMELSPLFSQGTPRRKKKIVHKTASADDKKLQSSLKKLSVNSIAGIEEVSGQKIAVLVVLYQCFFCVMIKGANRVLHHADTFFSCVFFCCCCC